MGTKNNPGKFDCYAKAEPNEPMFILLAKDRLAPFLVSLWSKIRNGDGEAARVVFEKMMDICEPVYFADPDVEKANEAIECSLAMFDWYKKNKAKDTWPDAL